MKLNNTVFVITGAGGGIGSELVIGILNRGGRVAAVDLKEEPLAKLQARAQAHGDKLSTHAINITDRSSVMALPEQVIQAHGAVDGLINCAGIIQPFVKVVDLEWEAIERVMNVNFFGTLAMTKAFLPHLLQRPEAHLVNVSSMGGFLPVPGQSVYGASKAAVKLLTEGLYAELLDTPVHVSVVFPGATNTSITTNSQVSAPGGSDVDTKKLAARMLPADKAAATILDGIENNAPHIYTGKDSKLMNRLYRLSPIRATKLIAKQMKALIQ